MTNFTEFELIPFSLKVILNAPDGIETKHLIIELRKLMNPNEEDLEILSNRSDDKFSQKVRNLKSHKTLENKGFVEFYNNKFFITKEGVKYLDEISWEDLDKMHTSIEEKKSENFITDIKFKKDKLNKMNYFQILDLEIKKEDLSQRLINSLMLHGVNTIGDLIKHNHKQLMSFQNFSKTSLEEVENHLNYYNLKLGNQLIYDDCLKGSKALNNDEADVSDNVLKDFDEDEMIQLEKITKNIIANSKETQTKEIISESEVNKNLFKKIDELYLSVRTLNCLKNENIVYVGDLIQLTENYLLKSNNFGRKSLDELKEILSSMSLYLGMELTNWPPDNINDEILSKNYLIKKQDVINTEILSINILKSWMLSVRTINCLNSLNIKYIGDIIELSENYLLNSNNFGRKSLEEIKKYFNQYKLSFNYKLDSSWIYLREKLIHEDKLSEINSNHEDIDGKSKLIRAKKSIFKNFETSREFNAQNKIFIDVNLKTIDVEKLIIQDIEIILSQLNIKYKNLFKYRYAYLEEFKTLEEAGIIYGVTRERIRQLEKYINRSLVYIGLIDKNSLIKYFANKENLSFHKFFPSLSENFRKLPRNKGTHDIGKNGLANFMENFCGVKEGFFKTTERVLSDFDTFKLQDIFLETPSGNDGESFLEIIQDYYGYDKFSANSAIELMVEKKLIKIVDNKIYAIKMNKNLEVAHILLNYPDGLHWKEISKLGNNSYTENKWSTNRIMADPSISMNVNNFIYLSNKGTHKLLKFCKELKNKEKIISIFKNTLKELNIEQDNLEKIYGKIIEVDEFKDLNYYDVRAIIKLFGEDKGLFYLGKSRAQVIGLVKKLVPNRLKERIKEIIINEQQEITVEEINNKLHRVNENATLEQNYNSLVNSLDDLVEEMVIFRINPKTYLNFNDAINLCDIIEVKDCIERLLFKYEFVISSFIREKINEELGYTLSSYYYESLCRKLAKDNSWHHSPNYLSNKKPKKIGTHKYIKNLINNNLSNGENYLMISKKIGISRMYFNNITYTKNIELDTDWVHQND